MTRFRPYVDAVQWTGSNVIEVRQFVRAVPGVIRDAVIRDGILYITQQGGIEFAVAVSSWLVRSGFEVFAQDPTVFASAYEADV